MENWFNKSQLVRTLQREHIGKYSGDPQGIIDIVDEVILGEEDCGNMKEMEDAGFSTEHVFKSLNYRVQEFADIHRYSRGIRGKNILEIGCGSGRSSYELGDAMSPLQARMRSRLGANVVGLDIGNAKNEQYHHIQVDLTKTPIRYILPQGFKPEIAIARMFFDSPTLLRLTKGHHTDFCTGICEQVYEILPEKGVFFTSPNDISLMSPSDNGRELLENIGFKYIGDVTENLQAFRKA